MTYGFRLFKRSHILVPRGRDPFGQHWKSRRDFQCWPKESQPLGTRMTESHLVANSCILNLCGLTSSGLTDSQVSSSQVHVKAFNAVYLGLTGSFNHERTSLDLRRHGLGGKRWNICVDLRTNFVDQSERSSSQVNARTRKLWPNGDTCRPKFSTRVHLRFLLARKF